MTRPRLSRGECPACLRVMHVRLDGVLRAHRDQFGAACPGSGQEPTGRHSIAGGSLDRVIAKVGQDFPAIGAIVRRGITGAA